VTFPFGNKDPGKGMEKRLGMVRKKIGVQKSLPPNRDDQNCRCSVEYVGGIGVIYSILAYIYGL